MRAIGLMNRSGLALLGMLLWRVQEGGRPAFTRGACLMSDTLPACPSRLIDLLELLGELFHYPEVSFLEIKRMGWWLGRELAQLTTIPEAKIMAVIFRFINGRDIGPIPANNPVEGLPPILAQHPDIREAYLSETGLNDVAEELDWLDGEYAARYLWYKLCREFPEFDRFVRYVAKSPKEQARPALETAGGQAGQQSSCELLPKPHPDGPEGGRWVWWKGEKHKVPKGHVYRLIEFMWNRQSAHYNDLDDEVFRRSMAPATVRSYANKVKTALPPGVPWRLVTDSVARCLTKETIETSQIPENP